MPDPSHPTSPAPPPEASGAGPLRAATPRAAEWAPGAAPPGAAPPGAATEADELRRLLLGDTRDDALDRVARNALPPPPVDAGQLARALPAAIRVREAQDHDLGDALAGPIERGLKASVERNPQPVVDAIFPVIGPAIRRAIRHAMAQSLEAVNQSVNYGLSWRGLRWRLEARRSGVSFGEIVLRHTLLYRVEEVLLVHRETGLLLSHVVASGVAGAGEDADVVGAMLTAVRQFVGDSFQVPEGAALDAIEVGDLTVWIEPGPRAVVAAVIRGHPPEAYRQRLAGAVETIHSRLGDALTAFTGETAPFDAAESVLEDLLDAEYAEPPRRGLSPKAAVLLLLLVGLAAWCAWRWWDGRAKERAYLEALAETPGLSVLHTGREGGRLVVVGARDPLALEPAALLGPAGLDASDVDGRWVTAFSPDTAVVARRAREALGVPGRVALSARPDGTLAASGAAGDTAWVPAARQRLGLVPGVDRLDLSGLRTDLGAARDAVEALSLAFGDNGAVPPPEAVEAARPAIAQLAQAARERGLALTLEVTGHTDDRGTPEANRTLGLARATAAAAALRDASGGLEVRTLSRGAERKLGTGPHPPSRRVTFRVLAPPPPAPEASGAPASGAPTP